MHGTIMFLCSPAQLESESQNKTKRNTKRQSTFIFCLCEGIKQGMRATHGLLFHEDVYAVYYQQCFTSNKQGPLEMCSCLICSIFALETTSVLVVNGLGPSPSMKLIAQKGNGKSVCKLAWDLAMRDTIVQRLPIRITVERAEHPFLREVTKRKPFALLNQSTQLTSAKRWRRVDTSRAMFYMCGRKQRLICPTAGTFD